MYRWSTAALAAGTLAGVGVVPSAAQTPGGGADAPPEAPVVTASDYPVAQSSAGPLSWSDGVGRYGTFTIGSPGTDVVKYQWGLDSDPTGNNEITTTGGAARTITVLPEKAGPHWISLRAIDSAGRVSPPASYYFAVRNAQPPQAGWAMDDKAGSTTAAGSGPGIEAVLGSGAASTSAGHKGNALKFDGTADAYAQAQSTPVETNASYTVSAWVNLADASRNRSAVSQGGAYLGAFSLGVRSGKWALQTSTRDGVGYAWQVAASNTPVVLNTWTHLVGVYDARAKTVTLYVNGVPSAPVAAPDMWPARGTLDIGRLRYRGGYSDPWSGSVDEVKLWERPLTAAEAASLSKGTMPATGTAARSVWELDETGTTVSGAPETSGLALAGGAAVGAAGVNGGALHLDGVDDYARTGRAQVDGARNFSVSTWVKLPEPARGDTADRVAVTQLGTHSSEFSLYYAARDKKWSFGRSTEDSSADTRVRAFQPACTADIPDPANPTDASRGTPCFGPTDGHWTHLVGVSDATAGKLRLYVNGYQVAETAYTQTAPWAKPGALQLGAGSREGVNGDFFGGDIDDTRLYDRVLTNSEIKDMARQNARLVGRWKLNAADAQGVSPDEGPFAAGATLGGAALITPGGGMLSGALNLDGTTGYAQARSVPLRTSESFSLAAWVQPPPAPDRDMTVLSFAGANGNSAVVLRWSGTRHSWQAEFSDSDSAKATRTAVFHTPQGRNWSHLALVYDASASRATLYVNGVPENQTCESGDTTCTPHVSTASMVRPFESFAAEPHAYSGLQFGRRAAGGSWGEFLSGGVDDVWLYQGALSKAEIVGLAMPAELPTPTSP
ncbi:LamG domain-containing protein [Kitasatospora sp. NPDC056138]|uniref:LamG domain-containing protein n=1 Tax=Kitasatospora sp. NPDC056138 TaxID=3345724 RepID=UPI0035DDD9A7